VKVSRVIRSVARGVGLAVLFVVVLELCARVDDWLTWGAPLWGHYSHSMLMVVDELGPHSRFGARFEKWRINSHGFRGPEITMKKPAGVTRILVIGASETFGLHEGPGKEFPAQMQQMLDVAEPGRYEVLNAGCAGMTLPRFTYYFGVWLRKFKPDITIIYPTPAGYVSNRAPAEKTKIRTGPPRKLPENMRLKRKTKLALKRLLPALPLKVRERRLAAYLRGRAAGFVWEQPPPERVALFKEHFAALVEEIQGSGTRIILATHAHRFPRDREAWSKTDEMLMTAWRASYSRASERCLLAMEDTANGIVIELGKRLGIPVVDIASAVPSEPENFADFSHFTDRSAQIVAKALTREILNSSRR